MAARADLLRAAGTAFDELAVTEMMTLTEQIVAQLKNMTPDIQLGALRERLLDALPPGQTWQGEQDIDFQRLAADVANQLDRIRKLKNGGVAAVPPAIGTLLRVLLAKVETCGVFLVPVGQLEWWLADANLKSSRTTNKAGWANEASEYIQLSQVNTGDIWDFVLRIGRALSVKAS